MKTLEKIQKLDKKKRKIIYWLIMTIIALILFGIWIKLTQIHLQRLRDQRLFEKIEFPKIQMPTFQIPVLSVPTEIFLPTPNIPTSVPTQ